jgi:hypothetical protein
MRLTKFLGGVVLTAAVAFLGYFMDVPNMLTIGIAGVVAICCLISGL